MPTPKTAVAWREECAKEKTVAAPEPIVIVNLSEGNKQETKEADLFCGDHAIFSEGTETCGFGGMHAIALTGGGPTELTPPSDHIPVPSSSSSPTSVTEVRSCWLS